ncbi:hypothetical protein SLEP1_g10134 [Rubroshorea leprosula]|uniref:Secreted protein n=1 Tax=Rubroshorea leprosula TaxID=152421 RepID=A0AAV5I753_9ROSI|nr:hypothetical protein SLEP1_g10134 [Rubroshorea leprosula]
MLEGHHLLLLLLLRFFPFSFSPESRRVFGLQTRRRPQEFPESSQFRCINQSISRKAVRPLGLHWAVLSKGILNGHWAFSEFVWDNEGSVCEILCAQKTRSFILLSIRQLILWRSQ